VRLQNFARYCHLTCLTRLHIGSKEAGPKVAAIFSIVESCRKLNVPIRQYLTDVLPGLSNRSIQLLVDLTPTAYAARIARQPTSRHPRPVNHGVPRADTLDLPPGGLNLQSA